ncbi:MAG: hypothetical protein OWQ57_01870 [Sulfobacillus sp.]|nr:hypothetical protein [Sulfobacillus sp.]
MRGNPERFDALVLVKDMEKYSRCGVVCVRWLRLVLIVFLSGLLYGCGVGASDRPHPVKEPTPGLSTLSRALAWVHQRTGLTIWAPTRLVAPRAAWKPATAGIGFFSRGGYGITLLRVPKPEPFNASPLLAGNMGQPVLSLGGIQVGSIPPRSVLSWLASYNLLGPHGVPPIEGRRLEMGGLTVYNPKPGLVMWHVKRWLVVVEAPTTPQVIALARSLAHPALFRRLPAAPGLLVVAPGAAEADWLAGRELVTLAGGLATPADVLRMVATVRPWHPLQAPG